MSNTQSVFVSHQICLNDYNNNHFNTLWKMSLDITLSFLLWVLPLSLIPLGNPMTMFSIDKTKSIRFLKLSLRLFKSIFLIHVFLFQDFFCFPLNLPFTTIPKDSIILILEELRECFHLIFEMVHLFSQVIRELNLFSDVLIDCYNHSKMVEIFQAEH